MAKEEEEVVDKFSSIVPALQQIQARVGYLSRESLEDLATKLKVSVHEIYGVASFYTGFRFKPLGKTKVVVCRGTACHVKGASLILEEVKRQLGIEVGETTKDLEYSLETVACIGCCALAPCVVINRKVETKMTPQKVRELLRGREKR